MLHVYPNHQHQQLKHQDMYSIEWPCTAQILLLTSCSLLEMLLLLLLSLLLPRPLFHCESFRFILILLDLLEILKPCESRGTKKNPVCLEKKIMQLVKKEIRTFIHRYGPTHYDWLYIYINII